jgi:Fe2+ or Zn2+ uptake regulation protein
MRTQNRANAPDPERALAETGLRATRQRVDVLRVLHEEGGHWTALQLHERLRRAHAGLSQKTVYAILDALVAAGLAGRVSRGDGPACYEAHLDRHYHAHCRACGRLFDVPASADGLIRVRTPLPRGFRTEQIHVVIEGRCARCRKSP